MAILKVRFYRCFFSREAVLHVSRYWWRERQLYRTASSAPPCVIRVAEWTWHVTM